MTLNVVGGGLILLGIALLITTVSLVRGAAQDPEVLAPLEVMADRKFTRADPEQRVHILNQYRLDEAEMVDSSTVAQTLVREPVSEPVRPWRDPFPHDDDAVDIVPLSPPVIDPLLQHNRKEQ
ncbi:MAG: hypothetical protein RIR69_749 [Actinomycetota bacterium]|jgi:hypothetical protein